MAAWMPHMLAPTGLGRGRAAGVETMDAEDALPASWWCEARWQATKIKTLNL